jgi:DNA processing protein
MDDKQILTDVKWIALHRLRGITTTRLLPLLAASNNLDDFLRRVSHTACGLDASLVLSISHIAKADNPELSLLQSSLHDWQWLMANNGTVVDWFHRDYPALLREISDPPMLLYCLGNTSLLSQPQLAVVGSRAASNSGLELTAMFAADLAASGFTITSGLAMGVDAAAHGGALAQGSTVAVIGAGLDVVYPRANKSLHQRIAEQGVIVSEYPLATQPLARNFPRRNRIIAGLSLGCLVVEAKIKSGSLITARLSLDYDREVFAVPGSIHNPLSRGPHQLIKHGATLVETSADIVAQLQGGLAFLADQQGSDEPQTHRPIRPQPVLSEDEQRVLTAVDYQPTDIDIIADRSGFAMADLASIILSLELSGFVLMEAGGYQRRQA